MKHDHIYTSAVERLAQLDEQRHELVAFIATYRKLAGLVEPVSGDPAVKLVAPTQPAQPKPQRGSVTEYLVATAMEILKAHGRPMKLGAIYNQMLDRGVVVSGDKPANNLGAKLSADKRLVTHKGYGWWFADEPIPGAQHPFDQFTNSDDPDTFVSEPSCRNGEAGLYPA
jgi:hypothetical protein